MTDNKNKTNRIDTQLNLSMSSIKLDISFSNSNKPKQVQKYIINSKIKSDNKQSHLLSNILPQNDTIHVNGTNSVNNSHTNNHINPCNTNTNSNSNIPPAKSTLTNLTPSPSSSVINLDNKIQLLNYNQRYNDEDMNEFIKNIKMNNSIAIQTMDMQV